MKKIFYITFFVFVLSGCFSTTPELTINDVVVDDGVDSFEVILLAQKSLKEDFRHRKYYKAKKAKIIEDFLTREYPDYWFVAFPSSDFDLSFNNYLVVIHKQTGTVQFSGTYVPLKTIDYSWVFQ